MNSKEVKNHPHILILHGILMNALQMFYLARQLRKEGFVVHTISYQSILKTPSANAKIIHKKILELSVNNLHIIGHSLGGLVIAHLLDQFDDDIPKGNIVMLGTPIQGSWFAQKLQSWPIIKKILSNSMKRGLSGENIPEWRSTRQWGMIAGKKNFGLASIMGGLPLQGDGTVMIKETEHHKINAHKILPVSHTGLVFSREVAEHTAYFFKYNHFDINKGKKAMLLDMASSQNKNT